MPISTVDGVVTIEGVDSNLVRSISVTQGSTEADVSHLGSDLKLTKVILKDVSVEVELLVPEAGNATALTVGGAASVTVDGITAPFTVTEISSESTVGNVTTQKVTMKPTIGTVTP